MRSISSLAVLFVSALTPDALAQSEATFPLPEDTAKEAAEEAPEDAGSEEQQTADDPATPAVTPAPPTEPPGLPPGEGDPNPYGTPPAAPPPLPGNPYGTVAHRPPTPAPNPYVGGPRRAPTPASTETIEKTNWSVGGGLLAETLSGTLSGLRYEGYGAINQSRLRPSLLFERRLTAALHLLLQPSVFYQKSRLEDSSAAGSSSEESSLEEFSLRFEGGLRWVANPGGPVELGMSHVISLTNYQAMSEGRPNIYFPGPGDAEIDEWTIGLSNSFLAERRLIPHLWLRMAVGLVGIHHRTQKIITYTESEDEETGETVESEDETTSNGFHVGLTPSLALQLRLTF